MPRAFVTGSHAYGRPSSKSDIDLVVLLDKKTTLLLKKLSDSKTNIRFGKLNVIACETQEEFNVWESGTEYLVKKGKKLGKKYGKDEAAIVFDLLREKVGVRYKGSSGSGDFEEDEKEDDEDVETCGWGEVEQDEEEEAEKPRKFSRKGGRR